MVVYAKNANCNEPPGVEVMKLELDAMLQHIVAKKVKSPVKVAQWFSTLVAMAMISAKIWVRVPRTTSGVLHL